MKTVCAVIGKGQLWIESRVILLLRLRQVVPLRRMPSLRGLNISDSSSNFRPAMLEMADLTNVDPQVPNLARTHPSLRMLGVLHVP
jgi:hypothetical protein